MLLHFGAPYFFQNSYKLPYAVVTIIWTFPFGKCLIRSMYKAPWLGLIKTYCISVEIVVVIKQINVEFSRKTRLEQCTLMSHILYIFHNLYPKTLQSFS